MACKRWYLRKRVWVPLSLLVAMVLGGYVSRRRSLPWTFTPHGTLGRETWTIGMGLEFVPEKDWRTFASKQIELLVQGLKARRRAVLNVTNDRD